MLEGAEPADSTNYITSDYKVKMLGDEQLKLIAQELVNSVKRSVSVDWTKRENARAQIAGLRG
ncbi:MAG: DUF3387 domain-containing protein [Nitrospinae bacterium]|nr:DUF3387 domain-containing protein [Nitrospinota bacterium]